MKMVLKHSVPVVVVQSHCSSVARSAMCNHLVALLYQTQLNIPAAPPVHSCTDTEQCWHKPRTLGVKPGPVDGIEFRKPTNSCADGIRSSLYIALNGYMPDMDLLPVSETYANFSLLTSPLVTTMEMSVPRQCIRDNLRDVTQSSGCYKGAEQQPGMASAQEN